MDPDLVVPSPPSELAPPCELLPPISEAAREALAAEAMRVNDRYLDEFLEEYAFCPYSKAGRQRGQVFRYVHYLDERGLEPVLERMEEIAADPRQVVSQVIMPLVEVGPEEWVRFCHDLTALGHTRIEGDPVLAVAPLHPELPFNDRTDAALVPLFRRTPDPTIQWVRLDGLAAIYEGRGSDTVFVDLEAIEEFLSARHRPPLWERIVQTNAAMARRLSIPKVEALLEDIVDDAQRSYARVLLGAD